MPRPRSTARTSAAPAPGRAASAELHKAAKKAESKIESLAKEKSAIEASLADPQVYNGPTAKRRALQVRFGKSKRATAKAETAWLKAQATVEASGG